MNKIRASKCTIMDVERNEEADFLNFNHYQGYIPSTYCKGLYYNNELVCLMSFGKPRFNKNYDWELLRLCTKQNYTVYGGASKLFHSFQLDGSIISYCNEDKFSGKVYEVLGFTKTITSIGYHYEKDGVSYNRIQFQKHKCLTKWPEFVGSNLTEKQMMEQKGYKYVPDTKGQSTWVYNDVFQWYIYHIQCGEYEYIGQHKYRDINDGYTGSGTILERAKKHNPPIKTILLSGINSQSLANKYERCMIGINKLVSKHNINILDGGTGYVRSKRKSVSNGHSHTEEWKKNHSIVMKNKWDTGVFTGTTGREYTMDEATKQKISKANTGKVRSEEQRKNISIAHMGIVQSEESKKKRSEWMKQNGNSGMKQKGYTMDEATKQKIRETMAEKKAAWIEFEDGSRITSKELSKQINKTTSYIGAFIRRRGYIIINKQKVACTMV